MISQSNCTNSYLLQNSQAEQSDKDNTKNNQQNLIPIDHSVEIVFNQQSIKTQFQKNQQSKTSVMHNVPLLLEIRKNGIVGDNLVSKDMGINKWKIGKMIGGGGSGRVYKALNITNGILSAVKEICLFDMDGEDCKTQIAILSTIHHKNIIRYIQHYHLPQHTWIFMQYVPGTLKNFYTDFGPPNYQTFMHFAKQLIIAIDYLHLKKIIHKDIKCANVMLTNKGVVKLTDFGCSKGFDKTASLVNYEIQGSRTQKGTRQWMAPQTIREGFYTFKTDIWSLGCTLLELATGIIPWSETKFDLNRLIMHIGKTQAIPYIPQDLNDTIKTIIKRCLVRDPNLRIGIKQLMQLFEQ